MRINSALHKYVLPKEETLLLHKAQFLEKQDLQRDEPRMSSTAPILRSFPYCLDTYDSDIFSSSLLGA